MFESLSQVVRFARTSIRDAPSFRKVLPGVPRFCFRIWKTRIATPVTARASRAPIRSQAQFPYDNQKDQLRERQAACANNAFQARAGPHVTPDIDAPCLPVAAMNRFDALPL